MNKNENNKQNNYARENNNGYILGDLGVMALVALVAMPVMGLLIKTEIISFNGILAIIAIIIAGKLMTAE